MDSAVTPKPPTITVHAPGLLDDPAISVARYVERSGLSRLTHIELTLVTSNAGSINADALLGAAVTVVLETPHATEIHGLGGDGASPMPVGGNTLPPEAFHRPSAPSSPLADMGPVTTGFAGPMTGGPGVVAPGMGGVREGNGMPMPGAKPLTSSSMPVIPAVSGPVGGFTGAPPGPGVRHVHGIITEIKDSARSKGQFMTYEIIVRPRVSRLERQHGLQLHADSSVPDTIAAVLTKAGFQRDSDFVMRLSATYAKRSFTLQFNESDFGFIARLAEHWGIGFFFEHEDGRDVMVFTDSDQSWRKGRLPELTFNDSGERVGIYDIASRRRQLPSRYVLRDYNQKTPDVDWSRGANIDNGDGTQVVEYAANFESMDECSLLLKARLDELQASERLFEGVSAEGVIDAGTLVQLKEHPSFADLWLAVTSCEYEYVGGTHAGDAPTSFSARFTAALAGRNVRPARTAEKPKVDGLLAGIIEPEDEADYARLDDAGSYKVRLLFEDPNDGPVPFARVRMAQPHGGQGYGMHFPLRPGTEVVLAFLNGDPDRPVIAGVVPNARLVSPIDQGNNTSNVIRTGGGNQVNFQDEAGREAIQLSSPLSNTAIQMGQPAYPDQGIVMQTEGGMHSYPANGMNVVTPFAATSADYQQSSGRRHSVIAGGSVFSSAAMAAGASDYVTAMEGVQQAIAGGANQLTALQNKQEQRTDLQRRKVAAARSDYDAATIEAGKATETRTAEVAQLTTEALAAAEALDPTLTEYEQAADAVGVTIGEANTTTDVAVQAAQAAAAAGPAGKRQAQGIIQQQTAKLGELQAEGDESLSVMAAYWTKSVGAGNVFLIEQEKAHGYADAAGELAQAIVARDEIDYETPLQAHREALAARRMNVNLPDTSFAGQVLQEYDRIAHRLMLAAMNLSIEAYDECMAQIGQFRPQYEAQCAALTAAVPAKKRSRQSFLDAEFKAVGAFVDARTDWMNAALKVRDAETRMIAALKEFEQARSERRGKAPASNYPGELQESYDEFVKASDAVADRTESLAQSDQQIVTKALQIMDDLAPTFPIDGNDLPPLIRAEGGALSSRFSTDMTWNQERLKLLGLELGVQSTADSLGALTDFSKDTDAGGMGRTDMMTVLQKAAVALEQGLDSQRNAAWSDSVGRVVALPQHYRDTKTLLRAEAADTFAPDMSTAVLDLASDNSVHVRAGERLLQEADMITISATGGGPGSASSGGPVAMAGAAAAPISTALAEGQGGQAVEPAGTVLITADGQVILDSEGVIEVAAPTIQMGAETLNVTANQSIDIGCAPKVDGEKLAGISITPESITFKVGETTIVMDGSSISLTADTINVNGNDAISIAAGSAIDMSSGLVLNINALMAQIMAGLTFDVMAPMISNMGVMIDSMALTNDNLAMGNFSVLAPMITLD